MNGQSFSSWIPMNTKAANPVELKQQYSQKCSPNIPYHILFTSSKENDFLIEKLSRVCDVTVLATTFVMYTTNKQMRYVVGKNRGLFRAGFIFTCLLLKLDLSF